MCENTDRQTDRQRERESVSFRFSNVLRDSYAKKKGAFIDANDISRRRRENEQTP